VDANDDAIFWFALHRQSIVGPRYKTAANEHENLTQCPSLPSTLITATMKVKVEVKRLSIAIAHVADCTGYNSAQIGRWAFNAACS
jgi:hypothetical protein